MGPNIHTTNGNYNNNNNRENTNDTGAATEKDWPIWKRAAEANPRQTELWGSPTLSNQSKDSLASLTITAKNMTDTEIDRILEDAKKANKELRIKDTNDK